MTAMIEQQFYKHPNNSSICALVLRYFEVPNQNRAKVKIQWWRMKAGKLSYCMNTEEKFEMPITYWKTWKRAEF
jgi:hypothetical protein